MPKPIVVGLIGGMGSGKGVAATILGQSHSFREFAFGDYVKWYAQDLFDLSHDALWGPSEKRTPAVREILQKFGTDCCRHFRPDIWVDKFMDRLDQYIGEGTDILGLQRSTSKTSKKCIVVPDVRFPNEAKALVDNFEAMNLLIVPETRHYNDAIKDEQLVHASETSMWDIPQEHIYAKVSNPGTFHEFARNIHRALEGKI